MNMRRRPTIAIMALLLLLLPGCLSSLVDDVDEYEDIWDMPDGVDWPRLDLGERTRTAPTLDNYDSCTELADDLRAALTAQTLTELDQSSYWHWSSGWMMRGGWGDDIAVDMAMDGGAPEASAQGMNQGSEPPSSSGASSGEDREGTYSETNNQEDGVDEADFIKFDGYNFYMINNNHLVIIGVPEHGNVTLVSDLELEGSPMAMLIDGDSLIIISSVSMWNLPSDDQLLPYIANEDGSWRSNSLVKFTVIDTSDKENPTVGRELYVEGYYETARLVNGTVRAVSHLWTWIPGLVTYPELPDSYWEIEDWEDRMAAWNTSIETAVAANVVTISALTIDDFAPQVYERAADGSITNHPSVSSDCSEFAAAMDSVGRGFTTITTMDLFSEDYSHELDHIASSWVEVYASGDVLVLAEPANDWWWYWRNDGFEDETNIHAFDISSIGETSYIGSGRVPGTVQDQFSISEWNGDIRVASTSDAWGRWWLTEGGEWEVTGPSNHITVLRSDGNGDLDDIGYIGGIAEGERIWSARFVGDKGYLVTFRNMDPLWTIDLSDPTNPQVIGELEIPGVSTYIHPLSEDALLTIGLPGGENGLGLDWSQTQISLFDVSNFSDPQLADTQTLTAGYLDANCENIRWCGWTWSYSEATYEHKAFTYWEPLNLLAVPLSTYRYVYDTITVDGRTYTYYGYEYVSKLMLIEVDAENGTLSIYGEVDHSEFYSDDDELSGWWSGDTSVRRSTFMGDFVYAFSAAGVSVTNVSTMETVDVLELPGYAQPDPYYYWQDDGEETEPDGDGDGESSTDPDEEPREDDG